MKNKPTPNEQQMFDQVRELCMLTSKACHKISIDCGIPMRLIVQLFISLMQQIFDETEQEINQKNNM